jgi:hypothetical protein
MTQDIRQRVKQEAKYPVPQLTLDAGILESDTDIFYSFMIK